MAEVCRKNVEWVNLWQHCSDRDRLHRRRQGQHQCGVNNFTLTHPVMQVNAVIRPGDRVGHWSGATVTMLNTSQNQNACHGAQVLLHYVSN